LEAKPTTPVDSPTARAAKVESFMLKNRVAEEWMGRHAAGLDVSISPI
jgi:hypothetical protein